MKIEIEGEPDDILRITALWSVLQAETSNDCGQSIAVAIEFIDTLAHILSGLYADPDSPDRNYLLLPVGGLDERQKQVAAALLAIANLPPIRLSED